MGMLFNAAAQPVLQGNDVKILKAGFKNRANFNIFSFRILESLENNDLLKIYKNSTYNSASKYTLYYALNVH